MNRGFSIHSIILSQKVERVLREEADWMQYEYLELKSDCLDNIMDYFFPMVFNDAINYLVLCGKAARKQEGDLVFYRAEDQNE